MVVVVVSVDVSVYSDIGGSSFVACSCDKPIHTNLHYRHDLYPAVVNLFGEFTFLQGSVVVLIGRHGLEFLQFQTSLQLCGA